MFRGFIGDDIHFENIYITFWETFWDSTENQILVTGRLNVLKDNYLGGIISYNISAGGWSEIDYGLKGDLIKYIGKDNNMTYIFGEIRSPAVRFLVCGDKNCFGPRKFIESLP
jgi:hypothetical protein